MTRNSEELESFVAFCKANPDLRFWQALRNWSGWGYVRVSDTPDQLGWDTFYWERTRRQEGLPPAPASETPYRVEGIASSEYSAAQKREMCALNEVWEEEIYDWIEQILYNNQGSTLRITVEKLP